MNSFTFLPIICRLFSYWRNTPGVLCPNNINEINFNFLLSQAIDARQILTVNIKQKNGDIEQTNDEYRYKNKNQSNQK